MNGYKLKIVKITREETTTLRLMLKLEWMRLTDSIVDEAISKQLEHTEVSQRLISFGEAYIIMDTPLWDALQELKLTGKTTANVSFDVKSYGVLHDLIKARFKVSHMNRVPSEIRNDAAFESAVDILNGLTTLFDRHRDGLDKAFIEAVEAVTPSEGAPVPSQTILN